MEEKIKEKSLREMYDELPVTPPKTAFVERVAEVTHKSKTTVYMWLYGKQKPDELTLDVLSKELGVKPETLFP